MLFLLNHFGLSTSIIAMPSGDNNLFAQQQMWRRMARFESGEFMLNVRRHNYVLAQMQDMTEMFAKAFSCCFHFKMLHPKVQPSRGTSIANSLAAERGNRAPVSRITSGGNPMRKKRNPPANPATTP